MLLAGRGIIALRAVAGPLGSRLHVGSLYGLLWGDSPVARLLAHDHNSRASEARPRATRDATTYLGPGSGFLTTPVVLG